MNVKLLGSGFRPYIIIGELISLLVWIIIYLTICTDRALLDSPRAPQLHLAGLGLFVTYFTSREIFQIFTFHSYGKNSMLTVCFLKLFSVGNDELNLIYSVRQIWLNSIGPIGGIGMIF